jgi:chromosome segregation ATPase
LEEKCLQQQEELDTIKEEKKQCTESKKKLQIELNTKVAELAKSVSNEEAMMARLASLDKERMNLLDEQVMLERKCKESSKELEKTSASLKNVKADLSKYKSSHEKSVRQV